MEKEIVKIHEIVFVVLMPFLSGCATNNYPITYNTEPIGASIVCKGENKGYSPVTLNYSPDENIRKIGTFSTAPCAAIWSSGARKDFYNTWDLNKFPNGVMQTLQRNNTDGYSQDAEFALKVQQMNRQQVQSNSAAASSYNNIQINRPVTCFTNVGITTCF